MAELIRDYLMADGAYVVQAWGDPMDDGRWQGWLVFVPVDGGKLLRTGRETIQSSRDALVYWAGGLTAVYLQGALTRAQPSRSSAA